MILSDSITAVCSLDRGRGRAFKMRRVTQQVAAMCLGANTTFHYRWLPSEWNTADGPSRGSKFPSNIVEHPGNGDPLDKPGKSSGQMSGDEGEHWQSEAERLSRQEEKTGSTDSRSGLFGERMSGSKVQAEISGMPGSPPARNRCSLDGEDQGTFGGQNLVFDVGQHVPGRRRQQPSQLHDSSSGIHVASPSSPQTNESAGVKCIQGWKKLDPPGSRLPLPWEAVCLMAKFMKRNMREEALMMLLAFVCYLRPGEVAQLRAKDLIPPVNSRSKAGRLWSLILHPQERGQASKIQEFDENILFDLNYTHCIAKSVFLWQGLMNAPGNTMIFSKGIAELRAAMTTAATHCNLTTLGDVHPYRLRHGGASRDFATRERDLAQIQRRGCWENKSFSEEVRKGRSVEPAASQAPSSRPSRGTRRKQPDRKNHPIPALSLSRSFTVQVILIFCGCAIMPSSCKNYRVAGAYVGISPWVQNMI